MYAVGQLSGEFWAGREHADYGYGAATATATSPSTSPARSRW
jgi:hypothetical protein